MPLVLDLSYNLPAELYPGGHDGFEHYLILKEEVCYDHRSPPNFRQLYIEGKRMLSDRPAKRLKRGLALKDGPTMFEYCLRTLAICEVPIDHSSSEAIGEMLCDVAGLYRKPISCYVPSQVRNVTPQLQDRALAACAFYYFSGHWLVPHSGSLYTITHGSVLFNAAFAANGCILRGFIPLIALRIGAWFATGPARFGVDVRELDGYKELGPLWKAYDDYVTRLQTKEILRLKKVAQAPNAYRCANNGCGIQATHKGTLRRCSGNCPPQMKPHYCSLYCQRRHWIIHREFCKRDTLTDYHTIVNDDGDPDWADVDGFRAPEVPDHDWDGHWPLWAAREGAEIFVDIENVSQYRKGEVIRIRTKTLGPECLNTYKRLWTMLTTPLTRRVADNALIDPPENMGFPR